ncbi:MAG: hypothetical protein HeimC2_31340 [Candidatus Heimdallarchaeota archaeon LC_2]|nr:MAG: hypothetical protein HeimC2_31340 [Candidatus Heimdallarchaeota archaeon LC_2]
MKFKATILLQILLLILVTVPSTSGHNVNQIEEMDLDVTPHLEQSRFGPVQVDISADSTFVTLATITDFTFRHGLYGQINITDFDLEFDGMEEYKFILHQEIYLDDILPLKLGSRSQVLSDNALRDEIIQFSYILGDLNDIEGFTSDYVEWIDDFSDSTKALFHYSLHIKLEIQRGTKQDGTIFFDYEISSYLIPNILADSFHKALTLTTNVFPSTIQMQHTSSVFDTRQVFLFLPIRLLPFYFSSPQGHSLNLTQVPISIYLDLEFENKDTDKLVLISQSGNNAIDTEDPILNNDQSKRYKISSKIKDSQLLTITISTNNYKGLINITASVKIKAIFTDRSLYAKNEYSMSPNQYILIMVFIGTVFTYKIVDYVDYRKYQEILAYKNYDLVEKDFVR